MTAWSGGPVLGIETSCDETSAALVCDGKLLGLTIASQDGHAVFGGVVPELAARAHVRLIDRVVEAAVREARLGVSEVRGVGVTAGPGLVGALLVGVGWAKGFAFARRLPLVGVHHMEAHLFAAPLERPGLRPPFIGLLVSGGHTLLLVARNWGDYLLLGRTRDDAAGEAFDKVARRLGLAYPGGPEIERAARRGDPGRYQFPRPMLSRSDGPGSAAYYDFSFSGLKTAVALRVDEIERQGAGAVVAAVPDLAAGFQAAVMDVLTEKTMRAVREFGCRRVVLGGGVARNRALRERLADELGSGGEVYAPSGRLASDNGAMVAHLAEWRLRLGERSGWALTADPSLPFPGLAECPGTDGSRRGWIEDRREERSCIQN